MTQPQSLRPIKFPWIQVAVAMLVATYVAINMFHIGGNDFVINLNNFIVTPLAVGVSLLAFRLWRQMAVGSQNRLLWAGLTIGWAAWTVAELWWAIAALIGQDVPYPSWADFFWLAGYLPMYPALWARIRSLPQISTQTQKIGIWAASLIILGFTAFFIFLPIFQNSGSSPIVENILNVLYPLADIILLILVLRLFFTYQRGMSGRAWTWLALGFVFFSVGDLAFAYANTANLYYPDQQVNLLSTLGVDLPYNLSYLFVLVGLFMTHAIQRQHQTYEKIHTPRFSSPNTHLLLLTKSDNSVVQVSTNYPRVFRGRTFNGKTISEALGISPSDAAALVTDIRANGILKERPFLANTLWGKESVWISGIGTPSDQGEYSGINLLVRLLTQDSSLDGLLTNYEKGLVKSLLTQTGTQEKEAQETQQLLEEYYRGLLEVFYNRVFAEGGSLLADRYVTELQALARQNNWQIGIQPSALLDVSALPSSEAQKALPILFQAAKRLAAEITDEASVNTVIDGFRSKLSGVTLEHLSRFELAQPERG